MLNCAFADTVAILTENIDYVNDLRIFCTIIQNP